MSRVVVMLQKVIGGPPQILLSEPFRRPEAETPAALDADTAKALLEKMRTEPLQPNVVKDVGSGLLKLLQAHPAIEQDASGEAER